MPTIPIHPTGSEDVAALRAVGERLRAEGFAGEPPTLSAI